MDYIDYREKLGLAFNDKEKQKDFIAKIQVYFQSHRNKEFNEEQERTFCYEIGAECLLENKSIFDFGFDDAKPLGFQRILLYLEPKRKNFKDFLSTLVVFANFCFENKREGREVIKVIEEALKDSHISYSLVEDNDGIFIFPNGVKELDDALVSQPLEWLKDYPKAYETFCNGLKQYSDGVYIRDSADNFRKALESCFQEFFCNTKNLDNNIEEVGKYLAENDAPSELTGMIRTLISSYKKMNDKGVKHNDEIDERYLEFLMYQTGIFIRMLIKVKNF